MNSTLLIAHFERISEAPDAVPRLRGFIRDLAVRGKLVEQNPSEGPAETLLNAIRSAKGLRNSTAGTALLKANDRPFEVPGNWVWSRLGEICSKTGSGSTPRGGKAVYQLTGVPFLRSQNIYNDGLRLDDVAYINAETHNKMAGTAIRPGDLLLNITGGSIGRSCIVPPDFRDANVSQHVAIIRPAINGLERYLHQLILSPYFQSFVINEQTGAGRGGLPKNRMDRIPVALPPLSEQLRIANKVDELMVLCDRLEQTQIACAKTRSRLANSALHRLNIGESSEEIRNYATFCIDNFFRLTTSLEQIQPLRQTIVSLAIRGQLTPQNYSEEPASELLKRIQTEIACAAKNTKIRSGDEKDQGPRRAFRLPSNWLWVRLDEIAIDFRYGTSVKCTYEQGGEPVLRIPNIDNGRIDTRDLKFGTLPEHQAAELRLQLGDILMVRSNGSLNLVGRAAMVEEHAVGFCYAGYLVRVRTCARHLDTKYLLLALNSPCIRDQIEKPIRTTVGLKNVNATELGRLSIPLPPLAEQHRIVARVRELMALCDRLEGRLSATQKQDTALLESVLHYALPNAGSITTLNGRNNASSSNA